MDEVKTNDDRRYSLERPKLSKSSVKGYEACPFKFHKVYIEGKNELDNNFEPFVRGRAVHKLLEDFYKLGESDINKLATEAILSPGYLEYKDIMDKFIVFNQILKENLGEHWLPKYMELKMFDKETFISGIIDRVQFDGEGYMIIDYKQKGSDYYKVKENSLKWYRFELALYTYLFEKTTGLDVKKWGVYYAQEGQLVYEDVDREEIKNAVAKVLEIREKINKELRGEAPIIGCGKCNYCKEYGGK
jgi:CRISPR/Cas system-associated exonuclease Cas4 (RecB family)